MRILQLSKEFNHGGLATHITELSEGLQKKGHSVIVATKSGTHIDELKKSNVFHYEINFSTKNPFKIIKNVVTLMRLILKEKINVVHCQNRICAMYMNPISKLIRVPFVWSIHQNNILSDFFHRNFTFYGKRVICTSSELKRFLCESLRIPVSDISIVHNGINMHIYNNRITEEEITKLKEKIGIKNEKVITLLGRLSEAKGHEVLLHAIGKLPNKKAVKIIFVGEGTKEYKQKLDKIITNYGIENQIIFGGFIPAKEVLSISDLMVLPSYTEGFPLAVLNAFALDVPVIRTKTGGYIDTKDYCIGMDFDDSEFLTHEINDFIDGKDYSKMIKTAKTFVKEKCSVEVMTNSILDIYIVILLKQKDENFTKN